MSESVADLQLQIVALQLRAEAAEARAESAERELAAVMSTLTALSDGSAAQKYAHLATSTTEDRDEHNTVH